MKTNEEIVELIKAGKDQKQNMETLFFQNSGIVKKMVCKYSGMAEADDLHQECFLALYEAVKCFDKSAGIYFISYWCMWMEWQLKAFVNQTTLKIHIPADVRSLIVRYREVMNSAALSGIRLSADQISSCLCIPKDKLADVIRAEQLLSVASMDAPTDNQDGEDGNGLYELIADDSKPYEDADEKIYRQQLKEELWALVDSLSASLSSVLHQRYEEGLTLEAIARKEGHTPELIRKRQAKALRLLRKPEAVKRLRPYLNEECYSLGLKGNGVGRFQNSNTSSTEAAAIKLIEMEKALIRKKIAGTLTRDDIVRYEDEVTGSLKLG